jgi:hypothetical protein
MLSSCELRLECLKFAQSHGDPATILARAGEYFAFVCPPILG